MLRTGTVAAIAIALIAAVIAAAAQGPSRPNILLITIDTLRADRVGAYGYKPAKTPTLDRLAAEGVRFADATAHVPLTLPSHAAILTGRYPGAFGLRLNAAGALPASAVTIAETLERAGYRTAAVVGTAVLDGAFGLAQGFDEYDDRIRVPVRETLSTAELQRPATAVTAAARRWIGNQNGPWFLWAHYYDPHLPYDPPARHAAAAPGRPYDGEIAYVDAEIGGLLAGIDRTRTAVVVTSDHGEALGEHGEADHGYFLYDSTLAVPLIVQAPGLAPRVVREQVRSIDIAPTIAELAGLPAGEPASDAGESLLGLMKGGTRTEVPVSIAESWYPRLHFGWSELRSVRVGEWKYISAPKPELYDLRVDQAEARNLVTDRASVAGRLAADLAKVTARFERPEAQPVKQPDPAAVQRLQALGYLGAFAPAVAGTSGVDPKDRVQDYQRYRDSFNRALGMLGRGDSAGAAAALQRLVKLEVRAFEAHLYLGNAYAAQKKFDAALGEYDAASQLNPSLASAHFEAAKVLSLKGDHAAAAARCRTGLEIDPQSFFGHYTLGVIQQRAERWQDASAAFQQAVALNDVDPRARAGLASVSMRLGDVETAAAQFEKMVELKYQPAPAQFNLGVIAMRRGDRADAARRFRLALEADPAFAPAREALAKVERVP